MNITNNYVYATVYCVKIIWGIWKSSIFRETEKEHQIIQYI